MKPTLYTPDQITEEQYHAETGYGKGKFLTRSMICDYRHPLHFKRKHIDKLPHLQTPSTSEAFTLGSLAESLIWGDAPGDRFDIAPKELPYGNKTCKFDLGNKTTQQWIADNNKDPSKLVTQAQWDMVQDWVNQLETTAMGQWFMRQIRKGNAQRGLVVRWTDETTGLDLQCMLDFLIQDRIIVDAKTTGGDITDFCRTSRKFGYDVQAAMYYEGFKQVIPGLSRDFLFALMEKNQPNRAVMCKLPLIQTGKAGAEYRDALIGIANEDFLPHGHADTQPFMPEIPAWLLYEVESED